MRRGPRLPPVTARSFVLLLAAVGTAACGGGSSAAPADAGAEGGPASAPDAGGNDDGSGLSPDAANATSPDAGAGAEAGPDAGAGADGGAFVFGAPITAPASTWTWVPFPNAFCANGTATGIGVNLSTTSSNVVVYLEGGGACWSDLTCYTLQSASNFSSGYGESNFTADSTSTTYLAQAGGFFDRTAAANPFKDASYVYVPYCTGDMHGGSNVVQYPSGTAMHVGYENVTAYLRRLVPTFPSATRVFLTGSGEGGSGALLNYGQTQRAFGSVRVDLIDDSGTFMPADLAAMGMGEAPWRTQWNLAAALPSGCAACATSLAALHGYYPAAFPDHRFSLLSYTADSVLPALYGITTAAFTTGLDEDLSTYVTPNANLQSYVAAMSGHVLWFDPTLATGGTTVQSFVTQLVTDDASWASVHP